MARRPLTDSRRHIADFGIGMLGAKGNVSG
jgi:hypothetical protein